MTRKYRDAKSGAYVTPEYAKANPSTTVGETDSGVQIRVVNLDGVPIKRTEEVRDGKMVTVIHIGDGSEPGLERRVKGLEAAVAYLLAGMGAPKPDL